MVASYSNHDTGILVPAQQRIPSISGLGILDESPPLEKVLVSHDTGQLAGDSTVRILHDTEVSGEEDVEEALMDLQGLCKL